MANQETSIMHDIMKGLAGIAVLFRNSIGFDQRAKSRYGLGGEGGSDLIGWRSVDITPDMVGKKVAVFVALEVKTNSGRLTEKQAHFINVVSLAGGIAGVATNEDDARRILDGAKVIR